MTKIETEAIKSSEAIRKRRREDLIESKVPHDKAEIYALHSQVTFLLGVYWVLAFQERENDEAAGEKP